VVVGVVAFLADEVVKEVGEVAPISKLVYHSKPEVVVMPAARHEEI